MKQVPNSINEPQGTGKDCDVIAPMQSHRGNEKGVCATVGASSPSRRVNFLSSFFQYRCWWALPRSFFLRAATMPC